MLAQKCSHRFSTVHEEQILFSLRGCMCTHGKGFRAFTGSKNITTTTKEAGHHVSLRGDSPFLYCDSPLWRGVVCCFQDSSIHPCSDHGHSHSNLWSNMACWNKIYGAAQLIFYTCCFPKYSNFIFFFFCKHTEICQSFTGQ